MQTDQNYSASVGMQEYCTRERSISLDSISTPENNLPQALILLIILLYLTFCIILLVLLQEIEGVIKR